LKALRTTAIVSHTSGDLKLERKYYVPGDLSHGQFVSAYRKQLKDIDSMKCTEETKEVEHVGLVRVLSFTYPKP
jgi:hypothetical protein